MRQRFSTKIDMRLTHWLEELRADVTFSLRQLRRAPAFTCIAAITLALGIGANSAIFALVAPRSCRHRVVSVPGSRLLCLCDSFRRAEAMGVGGLLRCHGRNLLHAAFSAKSVGRRVHLPGVGYWLGMALRGGGAAERGTPCAVIALFRIELHSRKGGVHCGP